MCDMNNMEVMQAGAVDELATTDARIEQLREKLRQLDELRDPLLLRIEKWNQNRPFPPFLRLPRELREMIYDRYNSDTTCYHEGYLRSLAQICRQVREEYIEWLGWNRPLVVDRWLYYLYRRYIDRGQIESVWPSMRAQIIRRVQLVDVEARPEAAADCRLNVASGEVSLIELTETDDLIQKQRWRQVPGKSSVCFERLRLLGKFIAEDGGAVEKEHFDLIFAVSRIDTGPTDPQAWLRSELQQAETTKILEMLPFSSTNFEDCSSTSASESGSSLSDSED
ncbi:hypothetical protein CKM354_000799200 [Cercospora kikuchii]|uniref:F-box domain-containing protein n=1 Tax=Cercospora kikuchii TaxID=84275 RepID=A0A9P3FJG2_9PEZI|nr:uncharacterized protein CKM354_000799200 [Cercospora kikuchii]GIZ44805.1 hypothetical protein CKM354_000799200 [Cercospora kikuchii]